MSIEPCLWTIFCDDIRQEAGHKLSYMGVYGPNLIVPVYPTKVPRLCCVFSLRLPAGANPRLIIFRLFQDDVAISVARMQATGGRRLIPEEAAKGPVVTVGSVMQVTDLEVSRRALLTTRVEVDGKELPGSQLELMAPRSAT